MEGFWIVTAALCVLSFLIGVIFSRRWIKKAGTLVVDKDDPETNGGIYAIFVDSFKPKDKSVVAMDVIVADLSHIKQG